MSRAAGFKTEPSIIRPSPVIGHTLAHYEIVARVGEGGMGVVYKARDTHLDRFVAIKVLNSERTADPERRRRFVQEAKAASALNHPSIVTIYDISSDHGTDFIAMEYVQGHTLDQLIGRWGLSPSTALNYAIQAAEALATAHAAGIVHRDIKPSNIMVTGGGVVKVLDFGVAKLIAVDHLPTVAESEGTTHTVTGEGQPNTTEGRIVGTIAYMSPEQAAGQSVDARSDIFSFGSVLYEMVTGVRAFAGTSSVSTLAALLNSEPKRPSEISTQVTRDFERIILRCLRKDPTKRFQIMSDLVVELDEIKTESGTRAALSASTHRKRSSLIAMAVIVAIGTGLATGALWLLKSASDPLPPPTVGPLTSYPGDERFATLSPDGNQVAFSWNGAQEDNLDIYVKPLGADASLRVTSDPADDSVPAWSPDGSRIAFVREQRNQFAIFLTPPVPGSERKLADFRPAALPIGRMNLSWTPDGNWLVFGALESNGPSLSLLPLGGGDRRILISNSGSEGSYCYPAISPSGRRLAYALCKGKDGLITDAIPCDVYVLDLDGNFTPQGRSRRLTRQEAMIHGIAWANDERSVVYGSLSGGRTSVSGHLWRVPISRGQPERMELAAAGESPTISRLGDKLVYTRDRAHFDIWKFAPGQARVSVLSSTANDFDPQLSPDGTKVAFVTERSGRGREIWVSTLDRMSAHPLTQATGRDVGSPRWSPDGGWLAFDAVSDDGNWDIYVVEAAGGQPRRLTKHPGFENFPSWSRDGKWIYFRSMRSGSSQVWRMAPDGTSAEQMTTAGGASAWESWDGQTLYYTRHDGIGSLGDSPGVFAHPLRGGADRQVLGSVLRWNFVPANDGIYYVVQVEPRRLYGLELRFLHFATGKSKVVSRFQARASQGLSVSADGKTVLYSGIDPSANADLMLIQNFR